VKNLNKAILGLGVLGIIGMFLPMTIKGTPISMSMWSVLSAVAKGQAYLVMAGFLAPAVVGGLSLKSGLVRWHSIVATLGFALVLLKLRAGLGDFFSSGIGPMLIVIATLGGLAVSILTIVKPQPK
jgi:hypothetical protein